jgi:hypothetical protein
MTAQANAKLERQGSFVSDFLGAGDEEDISRGSRTGNIAIAKDNARQIIGNIINNYFELPRHAKVNREWLNVVEWLTPSKEAVAAQALIHRDARGSQAAGTGTWFLAAQPFQEWLHGLDTLRWVHGSGTLRKSTPSVVLY